MYENLLFVKLIILEIFLKFRKLINNPQIHFQKFVK